MFTSNPLYHISSIISKINLALKKSSSSLVIKIYKNDFKYLDILSNYGYLYYTFIFNSKHFIHKKEDYFYIQIFFNNYSLSTGGKPSFKKITLISKSVSKCFVNKLGYSRSNIYSFIQPVKNIIFFISTSKGILPHFICKKYNLGGEVLFSVE